MKELDRMKQWIGTQGTKATQRAYYDEFIRPLIEQCEIHDVVMSGVVEVGLRPREGRKEAPKQIRAKQAEARRITEQLGAKVGRSREEDLILDIANMCFFYVPRRGSTPKVIVSIEG